MSTITPSDDGFELVQQLVTDAYNEAKRYLAMFPQPDRAGYERKLCELVSAKLTNELPLVCEKSGLPLNLFTIETRLGDTPTND